MNGNPFDPRDRSRRFQDPDLTRRILDRTSGRACDRAEQLLGARWDAAPDPADAQLLDAHLERCPACRELVLILDRLQPLLPGLAEREPGPAFTARVLARTAGSQPVPEATARPGLAGGPDRPGGPGLLERAWLELGNRARRAWCRPRFALEAAWTVATLLALLVWGPLAPDGVPRQADQVVRAGAAAVPEAVTAVAARAELVLDRGRDQVEPLLRDAGRRADALITLVRSWWALAGELAREDDPGPEAGPGAADVDRPAPGSPGDRAPR